MAATKGTIKAYIKDAKKRNKADLKAEVERNYRVIDLRGVGKDGLINMMVEAKFGRRCWEILES